MMKRIKRGSGSALEEGDEVDVVHEFVEVGAHLQLESATVGGNLDGVLELLHLAQVGVVDTLLPVLLVLEQQVQEVAVLLEGKVLLVGVHRPRQVQEVVGQVGHPPLVLLLRRQVRTVHLRLVLSLLLRVVRHWLPLVTVVLVVLG